jgi:two-component system response regulator FixJ
METHHDLTPHVGLVGVVDDDPAVRHSLKFALEVEGFAVGIYAGAQDLLQDDDLRRFRCLVIDQHMPGMTGLDLVAKLRDRQLSVPVVLITSHPPRALVVAADKAGVPIVE